VKKKKKRSAHRHISGGKSENTQTEGKNFNAGRGENQLHPRGLSKKRQEKAVEKGRNFRNEKRKRTTDSDLV